MSERVLVAPCVGLLHTNSALGASREREREGGTLFLPPIVCPTFSFPSELSWPNSNQSTRPDAMHSRFSLPRIRLACPTLPRFALFAFLCSARNRESPRIGRTTQLDAVEAPFSFRFTACCPLSYTGEAGLGGQDSFVPAHPFIQSGTSTRAPIDIWAITCSHSVLTVLYSTTVLDLRLAIPCLYRVTGNSVPATIIPTVV